MIFRTIRKKRENHERDKVRRPCVARLRSCLAQGILKRYPAIAWTCPPDHGKVTPARARQLYLDGYEKGVFDMTITAANHEIERSFLIEFKWGRNGYTTEQAAIADKFQDTPVTVIKIRDVDEFDKFLKEYLV